MKYRIKITTFQNDRCEYRAYVKKGWFWVGIDYDGKEDWTFSGMRDTRDGALELIDKHIKGNCKVKNIDFEYLTKG